MEVFYFWMFVIHAVFALFWIHRLWLWDKEHLAFKAEMNIARERHKEFMNRKK
jgi:hypothetical protein